MRLACGNGLGADVWTAFQRRFRVPHILEFYAATEGNVTLFNFEGRPGAIGFHALFVSPANYRKARFDPFTFASMLRSEWSPETRALASGACAIVPDDWPEHAQRYAKQ